LEAFSPMAVLERGYALVSLSSGDIVRSIRQAKRGTRLRVQVRDGAIDAESLGLSGAKHTPGG
jgi:exodeoxyribonuclease VII large subunit